MNLAATFILDDLFTIYLESHGPGDILTELAGQSVLDCARHCMTNDACCGFNYPSSADQKCQVLGCPYAIDNITANANFTYYRNTRRK